ncbi:MAG TPA: nucleotidyltransferase domain-containing protein [Candidatus Saccharimonadia bacterium]|jgi:predicted nucleotidyltransferase|nr:nucleotidyltransferase domain-containing protein [Candidatus Saccharimonadia bacterium]
MSADPNHHETAQNSQQGEGGFTDYHRFVLDSSRDPEGVAREHLHSLQANITAAQTEYPEIRGATVFGSTVKGHATPESDVDGYMFIDVDEARRHGRALHVIRHEGQFLLEPADREPYESVLSDAGASTEVNPLEGVFVAPISTDIISASVSEAADALKAGDEFRRRLEALPSAARSLQLEAINLMQHVRMQAFTRTTHHGKEEISFDEAEYRRLRGIAMQVLPSGVDLDLLDPPAPRISRNLSGLFHLGVSNQQLTPYRDQAIRELEALGPLGERVWQRLGQVVVNIEEQRRHADIYFPQTLAEAANQYGGTRSRTQEQ